MRRLIRKAVSHGSEGEFIAIADLETVWEKDHRLETFLSLIQGPGAELSAEKIEFIRKNLLRAISVLVDIDVDGAIDWRNEVVPWIHQCIEDKDNWDARLPTLERHTGPTGPFSWLSTDHHDDFLRERHYFTAVVIREGTEYVLGVSQRMPYVGNGVVVGKGANGEVTKHHIARGHLYLKRTGRTDGLSVAKKHLNHGPNLENEVMILKRVRESVLGYHGDIRIATTISLIYEKGSCAALSICSASDLNKILEKDETATRIHNGTVKAAVKKIRDLASALEFLHQKLSGKPGDSVVAYCHMDIKPDNILVYDIPTGQVEPTDLAEQWKLTDFGISSLSTVQSRWTSGGPRERGEPRVTYTVGTNTRQRGGIYQPPEVDKDNEKDMGRGSDIWSLGCVFAEVLAAKSGQLDKLRRKMHRTGSSKDGPFYQYHLKPTKSLPKLNSDFDGWLKKLGKAHANDKIATGCEEIIRKMMIVKRIRRITSEKLVEALNNLLATA
ncbi:kinase-like protein [Thozetella sp. PMI_491]|nr:kinase-like protein [Thozetella sp. PMI_491]